MKLYLKQLIMTVPSSSESAAQAEEMQTPVQCNR